MTSTLTAENSPSEISASVLDFQKPKLRFHWLAVIALAFCLRILFLFTVPPPPVVLPPVDDDGLYLASGLQIREYLIRLPQIMEAVVSGKLFHGEGMLSELGLEIPWGAMRRGPVYSFFLALVFLAAGGMNLHAVYVLQALLVSAAAGLCYWLGKKIAGPAAGLLAAFFVALYPPLIFASSLLLQESLAVFLVLSFSILLFQRLSRKNSAFALIGIGLVLFAAAFSRSSLVYFPFFLAALLTVFWAVRGGKKRGAMIAPFLLSFSAYLIPCALWTAVVSSEHQKAGTMAVLNMPGRIFLLTNLPDYNGWIPDYFASAEFPDEAASVFEKNGIALPPLQKWPSENEMKQAARRHALKHPLETLRILSLKFFRLWQNPYDLLWKNRLDYGSSLLYFHRFLVLAGLAGFLIMLTRSFWNALLLGAVPLYLSGVFSLVCVESRYNLVAMPFVLVFAAYAFSFVARNTRTFGIASAIGLLCAGLFMSLNPGRHSWTAALAEPSSRLKQEIFLPAGALQKAERVELKLDAILGKTGLENWTVWINGRELTNLAVLKTEKTPALLDQWNGGLSYQSFLEQFGKKNHELRQWFALQIPVEWLKENDWNSIEIYSLKPEQGKEAAVRIAGDFFENPNLFKGPLLQNTLAETSFFKFQHDDDWRLFGRTPLKHQGVKSFFDHGIGWSETDLSPSPGIQKGQYRLRISVQETGGAFSIY